MTADVSRSSGLSSSKILERELGKYLRADTLLQDLVGNPVSVLTSPSEEDTLPYLVYNEAQLNEWGDDTSKGSEHIIVIEVYSQKESEASVKEILDAIRQRLDWCDRYISISPFSLVTFNFQTQGLVRETDGQAFRGNAQFRALTGGTISG